MRQGGRMKGFPLLAGMALLASAAFGYAVSLTGSPDATATGTASDATGWTGRSATASAAAARDHRQTTWAESDAYAGAFDSRKPSGMMVFIR